MSELIALVPFGLFVVWIVFIFFTKKGRNIIFGGTIIKTWDGISGKRKIISTQVKVHAVDVTPTVRVVGLEIRNASIGSYQMVPISLSAADALALASLLEEAVAYQAENSPPPASANGASRVGEKLAG